MQTVDFLTKIVDNIEILGRKMERTDLGTESSRRVGTLNRASRTWTWRSAILLAHLVEKRWKSWKKLESLKSYIKIHAERADSEQDFVENEFQYARNIVVTDAAANVVQGQVKFPGV